jgi:hypothetical protein
LVAAKDIGNTIPFRDKFPNLSGMPLSLRQKPPKPPCAYPRGKASAPLA